MQFGEVYYQQASLLIRAIPHFSQVICFALNVGTAINLFIRNMPRLSVDLDLTKLNPPEASGFQPQRLGGFLRRALARLLTCDVAM